MQVQDSGNFKPQFSGNLYDSFSEASGITEELMTLKNRISALESENSLLRQQARFFPDQSD